MSHLVPCPGCQRHVRVSEAACPFCSAPLDLASTPAPVLPTRRLGRSALFAFGATLAASLAATSCGGDSDSGGSGGSSGSGGGSTGGAGGSGGGSTGGSGGSATGGASGGGGAAGADGGGGFAGAAPLYGMPADAGSDAQNTGGGGGGQPLYGAPPPPP